MDHPAHSMQVVKPNETLLSNLPHEVHRHLYRKRFIVPPCNCTA
jgi:hypothetical protein